MLRIGHTVSILEGFYGMIPLPPTDPFILFTWEVLSAQTAPGRRDAALAALRRIPALTPDSMWRAPRKKVEAAVALAGSLFDQRMGALRTGIDAFRRQPRLADAIRGPLGQARRAVERLPRPGGRAGAHRMLLFGGNHLVFPVDPGLQRVATRLGLGTGSSSDPRHLARSIRRAIVAELPRSLQTYRHTFVYMSHHSAATCTDADPHCTVCPLLAGCPEGERRLSSAKRRDAAAS
jgi:endonuclease III